jgi:hypothetical protein
MKKIIISLLVFFNFIFIEAGDYSKNIVAISVGIAQPNESFSTDRFVYNAGFADLGSNLEVDYFRYIARFFAINASIGYAFFSFDDNSYLNEYKRILANQNSINVETGNYHLIQGFFGLVLKTPQIKKMDFLVIPQLGYDIAFHPKIVVTDEQYGEINSIESSTGRSLSLSLKLKANYFLNEYTGICFTWGTYVTEPRFVDKLGIYYHFYLPMTYYTYSVGYLKFF